MKLDTKYILIVLILAILIILLFKICLPQISNKLVAENFASTTYPSVPCKKITLSSTDNNIFLFGILFYDDTGKLIDTTGFSNSNFNSSSVYNKSATTGYYPYIASKGIYNSFILPNKIVRNLSSLQNTIVNYNSSDNAINVSFTDSNNKTINLPASFGTWNIISKPTWVSATTDTYTNGVGNSYWSLTFPTQINLSAIEIIGTTSINTTMKLVITDNNNTTTFTQTLPKTAPRDYYRQIVMPCQFYINIPDFNGNITNNYVNYSTNGYLTSATVNSNSKPDSFFLMQDTGGPFVYSPNRQIIYSSDGQNKFIYKAYGLIKMQKQDSTTTYNDDHIQIRIGDFTNNPINTSLSYLFGDYNNYGYLNLFGNSFQGSSSGTSIKLIPSNILNQITTTAPNSTQAPTTTATPTATSAPTPRATPTATSATTTTMAPTTATPTGTSATTTTMAPTTATPTATSAPTTTMAPTTTPFITTPYNTQYLSSIQNQIDNGYSMLNNNRFTIMDNQLRLDNLNSRINKLLNNIQKINNISNNQNTPQPSDLSFY